MTRPIALQQTITKKRNVTINTEASALRVTTTFAKGVTSDPGIAENIEQMLTLRTFIPFGANATRVAT
jgi:hypothetical protein